MRGPDARGDEQRDREDCSLIVNAAAAAGRIALDHFRHDPETWDKGSDLGPVTEADLAVDAALRERLCAARPEYGWLSEESADTPARLSRESVFIVDPIDGTRAFIEGGWNFSVVVAVVRGGRVGAGVVHMPARDKTYSATQGGGARLNGKRIRASRRTRLEGAGVLASRRHIEHGPWRSGPPPVRRHFRSSLAYRLCLVAEGRFDAALTFRDCWEWDVAGADLICREAGAGVTGRGGLPHAYYNREPRVPGIVAAPQALHASLMAQIRP